MSLMLLLCREDKKLKMDVVKRYFSTYLVEAEHAFQNEQLQATNIEEMSGEVSRVNTLI
jgi:hypothetical protein